jgi:predicted adenylyl cyclase CyaB
LFGTLKIFTEPKYKQRMRKEFLPLTHLNIEIKARCSYPEHIRGILKARKAVFKGIDQQVDTYFKCSTGRLKLREGTIENAFIHYNREDKAGPKTSTVTLYYPEPNSILKKILTNALGTLIIVKKKREIYFIDNIKFHIDTVDKLGNFIEIEAIDKTGAIGQDKLYSQCKEYMKLFEVKSEDLIKTSYSDMLLALERKIPDYKY